MFKNLQLYKRINFIIRIKYTVKQDMIHAMILI